MNDRTIDEIVAEMHKEAESKDLFNGEEVGEPLIRGTRVEAWADCLDAATGRERENLMGRIKYLEAVNERLTKKATKRLADFCLSCAKVINGNAAAMRKELETLVVGMESFAANCGDETLAMNIWLYGRGIRWILSKAAPARNCDRFATVGAAHKAWRATDQERDFADWLFAPAEGGAE